MGWKVGHVARTAERSGGVVVRLASLEPGDDPFFADVRWPDGRITREYTRDMEDGRASRTGSAATSDRCVHRGRVAREGEARRA